MRNYDSRRIQPEDVAEALALLTRLPVTSHGERGAAAAWAWPLAGAIVAVLAGIVGWIALGLGFSPAISAAVALIVNIAFTGGMHEDGLADCADGFWGSYDPYRRLEIMADSRIGSFGVIALVMSLIIRWTALSALFSAGHVFGPLLVASALSRVPMVAVSGRLLPVREGGLSHKTGQPDQDIIVLAGVVGLIVALLFSGFAAFPVALTVVVLGWATAQVATAKIGGQTGDVLGATQQIAEVGALTVLAAALV